MSLVIGLAGDCMLGRLVNNFLKEAPSSAIWGDLLEELKKTDLNLINLENAFTTSGQKVPKVFNFKSDPKNVQALIEAKIDVVNLANNHVLDFSEAGLFETLETLDKAGIHHVGAGKHLEEAKKPVFLERKGVRIGILGYTDNEPSWNARDSKAGIRYLRIGDKSLILKDINAVRPHVDVLIVSLHWGPNMREAPSADFRRFARFLIENGVDILHGHSAHIFQGVERVNRGLILYDTGDFVDDYAVDPILRNDQTFLFLVHVSKKGVEGLDMIPAIIRNFCVYRARGEEKQEIQRRMEALSKELENSIFNAI